MLITHEQIIEYLHADGFIFPDQLDNEQGICMGFHGYVVTKILMNEVAELIVLLRFLGQHKPAELMPKIELDKNLYSQVSDFLKMIKVIQDPLQFASLYPKEIAFNVSDLLSRMQPVIPEELNLAGGIVRFDLPVNVYSGDDLSILFSLLKNSFLMHGKNMESFAGGVSDALHSIAIGFDIKQEQWYFADPNQLAEDNIILSNSSDLSKLLLAGFNAQDNIALSIKFYAKKSNQLVFMDCLQHLQNESRYQAMQIWTQEKRQVSQALTGIMPLHLAAKEGDMATIRLIIEQNQADLALIDVGTNDGTTALMMAAANGSQALVTYLLQQGSCLDNVTNNGDTALTAAVEFGHEVIVKQLIAAGASNIKNNTGKTALQFAMEHGYTEIIRLLIDQTEPDGSTSLFNAAYDGDDEIVYQLIEAGADICKGMASGATPLFVAAQNGHINIVKALSIKAIQTGSIAACLGNYTSTKETLLAGAAAHDVLSTMEALLNQKSPDVAGNVTVSPREIAQVMGYQDIVAFLDEVVSYVEQPPTQLVSMSFFNHPYDANASKVSQAELGTTQRQITSPSIAPT